MACYRQEIIYSQDSTKIRPSIAGVQTFASTTTVTVSDTERLDRDSPV